MKRLLSWGLLAAFFGVVTIFSSPALALPPTNDNLRDAVRTTLPFLHQTNMGESTKEIDESSPTCGLISGSAWYRYDSVSAQTIRATTYGSSSDFILAAYKVNTLSTGFSFADLEAVACNDNSPHSTSQASVSSLHDRSRQDLLLPGRHECVELQGISSFQPWGGSYKRHPS